MKGPNLSLEFNRKIDRLNLFPPLGPLVGLPFPPLGGWAFWLDFGKEAEQSRAAYKLPYSAVHRPVARAVSWYHTTFFDPCTYS